jgi:hypothetical protein
MISATSSTFARAPAESIGAPGATRATQAGLHPGACHPLEPFPDDGRLGVGVLEIVAATQQTRSRRSKHHRDQEARSGHGEHAARPRTRNPSDAGQRRHPVVRLGRNSLGDSLWILIQLRRGR